MAYQGPNVQVRQQFVTSPGAVEIEDLPPTIVASAFDVYAKEKLGSAFGIADQTLPWSDEGTAVNDVVHDETVLGQRALDFYPPTNFANSRAFGQIELDDLLTTEVTAAGVTITKDKQISIPGAEKASGNSKAIIPYYKLITGASEVNITAADDNVVTVVGGAIKSADIQIGQKVFVTSDGGTSWTEVGVVGSLGNSETQVTLATSYSGAPFVGDGIVIGAATDTTEDNPDSFYDPDADFVTLGVKPGDTIEFTSLALPGTTVTTSIKSVTSKLLKFNTIAQPTGQIDYNFHAYQTSTEAPGATIKVDSYDIKRYLGFSENRGFKLLDSGTGIPIDSIIGPTSFTILDTFATKPLVGDLIAVTVGNVAAGTDERDTANLRVYKVTASSTAGGSHTISTDEAIFQSGPAGEVAIADTTDFLHVWGPKIETDIVSDFRAIRTEEAGVIKRITSVDDIFTAFVRSGDETISPFNELAFMANIAFSLSGGKVMYAANVDASTGSLATEYTEALDELKLIDSYSHAFGTTDGGVNALMAPYVLAESDPYQGHEKIGILAYDQEDVFLMGLDTGSVSAAGVVTLDGAFDPITAGVTIKDTIDVYSAAGVFEETLTVTETPTVSTTIQTGAPVGDNAPYGAGHTFRIKSGRKNDQAIRIAALGEIDERRVSVVWPGWFWGVVDGNRIMLPPYYISAAVAGMDSGQIASQSFTNLFFSIPGVSSIELNTNHYFSKSDLDVIGAQGISLMKQTTSTSNSIASRHDLTTDMSAVQLRERSITKQADVAAKTIRDATSPYIGKYNITDQLLRFLGQVSSIVTTALVRDTILKNIRVVSIKRDEVIDDKINFVFEATAFIAGNFYDITLIVKTR